MLSTGRAAAQAVTWISLWGPPDGNATHLEQLPGGQIYLAYGSRLLWSYDDGSTWYGILGKQLREFSVGNAGTVLAASENRMCQALQAGLN